MQNGQFWPFVLGRLRCLPGRAPGATLILRLAGALLTFALASAACQAPHSRAEWSGLAPAWPPSAA